MAKANKELGQFLRDARKSKHLSRRQLAERSGISESLIALMESGIRGVTKESAEKISHHLGVPPSRLYGSNGDTADKSTALSGHIIYQIFDIVSLRSAISRKPLYEARANPIEPSHNIEGLAKVQDAIGHIIALTLSAPIEERLLRCYIEGSQSADREGHAVLHQNDGLRDMMDLLIAAEGTIDIVVRLGHSPEHDLNIVLWIIDMSVRYGLYGRGEQFIVKFLKGTNVHRFPRDVWYTPRGFVDSFPLSHEYSIEQAIFVDGNYPAIARYLNLIGRHVSPSRIEVFFPENLLEVCQRLNEPVLAETKLVQPFFTTATRPIGDFTLASGGSMSAWLRRLYRAHSIDPDKPIGSSDVTRRIALIAKEHEKRAAKFVDHCEAARFIQIFDRETVVEWAKSGRRLDAATSIENDSPLERLERIDNIVRNLERFSNFHLIAHPDLSVSDLTVAIEEEARRVVSWLIEGNARLVVGGSTRRITPELQRDGWKSFEDAGEDQLTIFISTQDIVDVFRQLFDSYLAKLDLEKSKRETLEFLKGIRSFVSPPSAR